MAIELAAPILSVSEPGTPSCRFCGAPLTRSFADLGMHPPCQSVVRPEDADMPETTYPLHARVCDACSLVQIPDVVRPEEIYSEYAYFSSFSDSWVAHATKTQTSMPSGCRKKARSQAAESARC